MSRFFFLAYAALCYLVFFATFVYSIGFLGNWGVPRSVDAGGPERGAGGAPGANAGRPAAFALGLSLGPCLTACVTVPRELKPLQRRVALVAGSLSLLPPALLAATGLDLGRLLLLLLARGS